MKYLGRIEVGTYKSTMGHNETTNAVGKSIGKNQENIACIEPDPLNLRNGSDTTQNVIRFSLSDFSTRLGWGYQNENS